MIPNEIKTDRSRIVSYKCPRYRYLAYELRSLEVRENGEESRGWSPARPSFDIEIGSGVHKVMEKILGWWMKGGHKLGVDGFIGMLQSPVTQATTETTETWIQRALEAGFKEFEEAVKSWLDGQLAPPQEVTVTEEQMAAAGVDPSGLDLGPLGGLNFDIGGSEQQPELLYQYHESLAMLEALARAYILAPSGLKWLLDTYEVLAVEQEVTVPIDVDFGLNQTKLLLMGRPDGILRDRHSGHYFVLSFKTTKEWDKRKEQAFKFDDQGLSESIVGDYWLKQLTGDGANRIFGVQTVALLKGGKRQDKGSKEYRYTNGLIRPYKKPFMNEDRYQLDYSWEDENGNGHNIGKGWTKVNLWEAGQPGVAWWLGQIASGAANLNGYEWSELAGDYVGKHPLDGFVVNPIFYRNEEDLGDWMEMMVSQETNIRRDRENIESLEWDDVDRRRGYVNCLFPMRRGCCTYPVNCEFIPVCHEGVSIGGSGLFTPRKPNHPQESGE
jgi:hypothetical protein